MREHPLKTINLCPACALLGDMVDAAQAAGVLPQLARQLSARGWPEAEVLRVLELATHSAGPCMEAA
jgi:hypothetical protein